MTGDEVAVYIDRISIVLVFLFPIWAVIRFRVLGLFAGAAFSWMLSIYARAVMDEIDSLDGAFARAIGMIVSGIGALVYSALIYAISLLFRKVPEPEMLTTPLPLPKKSLFGSFPRLHPIERIFLSVVLVFLLAIVLVDYKIL